MEDCENRMKELGFVKSQMHCGDSLMFGCSFWETAFAGVFLTNYHIDFNTKMIDGTLYAFSVKSRRKIKITIELLELNIDLANEYFETLIEN